LAWRGRYWIWVEGLEAALGRQSSSPVGLVRVGVSMAAGRFLAPRLSVLLADHPGLKVELIMSDRSVDMIEDRLDLAVRRGEVTDASLLVRRAGTSRRVAVAAPSYLKRHGPPSVPAELAAHGCLVHDIGPDSDLWSFSTPEGTQQIHVTGAFTANDSGAVHLAANSGQGIAFLPIVEVFDDLPAGQLVQVLSDFLSPDRPVTLAYLSRRHLAPRTRLVMDFIVQQFQQGGALLAPVSD
jgi:DNA-binding transcriptional LysR family regulator